MLLIPNTGWALRIQIRCYRWILLYDPNPFEHFFVMGIQGF